MNKLVDENSRVLDSGTGAGEKVLKSFPKCKEILATDISTGMIETANKNLEKSGRADVTFKVMDNLDMNVPSDYFNIVVARNTVTAPNQIYKCSKKADTYLYM